MKRITAGMLVGLLTIVGLAPSAGADGVVAEAAEGTLLGIVAPEGTEVEVEREGPYRLALDHGERIGFEHEGPMCWNFRPNKRGRMVALIVQGEREVPGAPCQGRRTAVVRLPWDIQEDGLDVYADGPWVYVVVF